MSESHGKNVKLPFEEYLKILQIAGYSGYTEAQVLVGIVTMALCQSDEEIARLGLTDVVREIQAARKDLTI